MQASIRLCQNSGLLVRAKVLQPLLNAILSSLQRPSVAVEVLLLARTGHRGEDLLSNQPQLALLRRDSHQPTAPPLRVEHPPLGISGAPAVPPLAAPHLPDRRKYRAVPAVPAENQSLQTPLPGRHWVRS